MRTCPRTFTSYMQAQIAFAAPSSTVRAKRNANLSSSVSKKSWKRRDAAWLCLVGVHGGGSEQHLGKVSSGQPGQSHVQQYLPERIFIGTSRHVR